MWFLRGVDIGYHNYISVGSRNICDFIYREKIRDDDLFLLLPIEVQQNDLCRGWFPIISNDHFLMVFWFLMEVLQLIRIIMLYIQHFLHILGKLCNIHECKCGIHIIHIIYSLTNLHKLTKTYTHAFLYAYTIVNYKCMCNFKHIFNLIHL